MARRPNKDKLHDLLMTKYNKDCDGNKYQNDGGVMGRLLHASDFFKPIQDKLLKNYDVSEKEQAIKLLDLFDLIREPQEQSMDDISSLVNIIGQEFPITLVDII